jgi:hypothetical protein
MTTDRREPPDAPLPPGGGSRRRPPTIDLTPNPEPGFSTRMDGLRQSLAASAIWDRLRDAGPWPLAGAGVIGALLALFVVWLFLPAAERSDPNTPLAARIAAIEKRLTELAALANRPATSWRRRSRRRVRRCAIPSLPTRWRCSPAR